VRLDGGAGTEAFVLDETLRPLVTAWRRRRFEGQLLELVQHGAGELAAVLGRIRHPLATAAADHAIAALEIDRTNPSMTSCLAVAASELTAATVPTTSGPRALALVPSLTTDALLRGSSPPLFGRGMEPVPEVGRQLSRVLALVAALDDFSFVEWTFSILVLTADRSIEGIVHASEASLIGTIYSNSIDEDWRFGEMIVHESAHSTLTACALAMEEPFSSTAMFASPWKGRPRPLVLFLQAVFAFAAVARYQQLILARELVPSPRRSTVAHRLSLNLGRMEEASDDLPAALGLIQPELRPVLVELLERVRAHDG